MSTLNDILWRHLALRDDYPAGTCWAWMDAAERVCGAAEAPATPHLCGKHATVARRRAIARAEREAARRAAYDAETERLRPKAEAQMAALRLRLAQLDRPVRADAAVVNVPLSRRMPTDEQIAEIVALDARLRRLEARFGGAR